MAKYAGRLVTPLVDADATAVIVTHLMTALMDARLRHQLEIRPARLNIQVMVITAAVRQFHVGTYRRLASAGLRRHDADDGYIRKPLARQLAPAVVLQKV